MNKMSISRKQGNFPESKTTKLSMLIRTREGATTFLTQHGPFSPHVASRTRIDLVVYIYIQKGSAFFKYYLKILIRMAIMPHTRAKTELRNGRPNLLQSVINTAKQLGKCNHLSSWCGRKGKLVKQDLFRLFIEETTLYITISSISSELRGYY